MFPDLKIILASRSPRRKALLEGMGLPFTVRVKDTDETCPPHLEGKDIALYVCARKADAFPASALAEGEVLITADTIVWLENALIGKPADAREAEAMLKRLSGKMHEVVTGVCLKSRTRSMTLSDSTLVFFRKLSDEDIRYYVACYRPLDKAGAYGIQEWIGHVGVARIEGSFNNVMGLPTEKLYEALRAFTSG